MDTVIKVEAIENYKKIDILLAYILIFINFLFYIIISIILKSKNKYIILLKYKLFALFIVDIIYRISYFKTYFFLISLSKELIFSLLASAEFFIILNFLNEVPKKLQSSREENEKNSDNLDPFNTSTIFFFFIFSYDKFTHGFTNIIYLIENIALIGGVFKLYGHLRNNVLEIILIIKNKINNNNEKAINNIIETILINPLIFFTLYYIMKIVTIFIENEVILVYINIVSLFFKELSKYLIFVLLTSIVYSLEKYVLNKGKKIIKSFEEDGSIDQV